MGIMNRLNSSFKRVRKSLSSSMGKQPLGNHFSVESLKSFAKPMDDKLDILLVLAVNFFIGETGLICKWLPNLRAGLAIYEIIKERN